MERKKLNIIVILFVGFGMPIYYKIKFLILGLVSFQEIWNWTFLLEIGFGMMLSACVVYSHDRLISFLRKVFPEGRRNVSRFIIQYLTSTLVAVAAAVLFSVGFWNYIMKMPITSEFIFDYALLGFMIPLIVNGVSESLFFYGLWEKTTMEKERLEKENIRAKYEALQSQISPHFLFNCFNTLHVLIKESRKLASDFLQQLSKVYRYVLEVHDVEMVRIKSELESLHSYLELMKHRYGMNIKLDIQVTTGAFDKYVAPLTLQMLMENALKHNQFSEESPLNVTIQNSDNWLIFGNTLRKPVYQASGTGTGLKNLMSRYSLLTGKGIKVEADEERFEVKIPMTEISQI